MVRIRVMLMVTAWTWPVFQTARISVGLIVRNPTTMSRPARAGMAISPTTLANATMMTAMTTLAMTWAALVLDPAVVMIDVADIEPPTGMPWKVPDTRLPTP